MAHPRVIAYRSAMAMQLIKKAASALAEKFGVEFAPLPNQGNRVDAVFARALELEHVGNFLQELAVASKAAKKDDFAPTEEMQQPDQPVEEKETEPIPADEVPNGIEDAAEAVAETKGKKSNARSKRKPRSK